MPDQADVLVAVGAQRLGDLVAGVGQRLDRDRVAVGPGRAAVRVVGLAVAERVQRQEGDARLLQDRGPAALLARGLVEEAAQRVGRPGPELVGDLEVDRGGHDVLVGLPAL
ncbi:hypothetical protein [Pseudonocardia hydrocarbonoxydans]|uniref:hypothetical protein n=1 Tax=Pseudonocardia hydrocarbonoxydans TaxID=76726 RepID=UPI001476D153|nr:hypothetical protein [Pseudonocardia hydrocarbonoxydans]